MMATTFCQASSAMTYLKIDGTKKETWLVGEVGTVLPWVQSQVTSTYFILFNH